MQKKALIRMRKKALKEAAGEEIKDFAPSFGLG